MMHFYYPFSDSNIFWIFNLFFSMLFPLLLIIFLALLIKKLIKGDEKIKKEEGAIEILKKRYARGEISKEEFDQMKKDLED